MCEVGIRSGAESPGFLVVGYPLRQTGVDLCSEAQESLNLIDPRAVLKVHFFNVQTIRSCWEGWRFGPLRPDCAFLLLPGASG